jgi:hypothetical protein
MFCPVRPPSTLPQFLDSKTLNWCFVEPTYAHFSHHSYVASMFLEPISQTTP